ncbi:MAG: NADH-quinone oxidoreductase subunit N [Spirochaetota bacterium]|nr:NADH-quinone oxidoreductase subunit N [Spirochaetota bacterium]
MTLTHIFTSILPIVILTGFALLVLIVEAVLKKDENKIVSFILSLVGILASLIILFVNLSDKMNITIFGGSLRIEKIGLAFSIIICFGALLVVLISHYYIKRIHSKLGEFYSLILFATVGMISMAFSNDMMTFFISLEVMSIAIYVLAGFNVRNLRSNESALKYFIMGAFSSAFLLLGIAFIYGTTGVLGFNEIKDVLSNPKIANFNLSILGLGFILIGFLFKIGAFPFHQWVPDVYEGAPTSVTAFMATGVKTAAFAIIIRILFNVFELDKYSHNWVVILAVISALTMIIGNFIALVQTNIKRLLAYSGIAHTGYILLGIIAAKFDNTKGQDAVIFYLLAYTIMNIGAFAVLISASKEGKGIETLEDIRGLGYRNKLMAMCMAFLFFSLAGIPTTAGFMGKFFIFKELLIAAKISANYSTGLYILAIIGIGTAIVSVYYYLKVVVYLYLKEESLDYETYKPRWNHTLVVFITFILTLILGIFPYLGFNILNI